MPPLGFLVISLLAGSLVGLVHYAALTRSSNPALTGRVYPGPWKALEQEAPCAADHPPLEEAA